MTSLRSWLVPLILLGVIGYALAEDLTLTTYYPSPRGVYQELRTSGDVAIGTTSPPRVRLEVQGAAATTGMALLITNQASGLTPALSRLAVTNDGQVGLGMRPLSAASPQALIIGTSAGLTGADCGSLPWQDEDGDSTPDPGECKQVHMAVTQAGQVGIGTTSPNTALDLAGALSVRGMAAPAVAPSGQGRLYFDASANKFQVSEHGGAYRNLSGASWQSWTLVGQYNSTRGGCPAPCDTGITLPADRELFYISLGVNADVTLTAPEVPEYVSVAVVNAATCAYFQNGYVANGACGTGYNVPGVPRGPGPGAPYSLIAGGIGPSAPCTLLLFSGSNNLFVQTQAASGYNMDCFVAVWQR